ncbi:MAG TPA: DEAD/DEAH box helicase [Myxococcota bacterium]|jgi:DEAD/DEAH box helicase domain-containing protein|nr:DEAD/DEAH box helicase [Myxococcota bacterium]
MRSDGTDVQATAAVTVTAAAAATTVTAATITVTAATDAAAEAVTVAAAATRWWPVVEAWRRAPETAGAIAADRTVPPTPAAGGPAPAWLHGAARGALGRAGGEPWAHQLEAWERWHEGQDVIVVTPTASGKSRCYAVPALDLMARDARATVLLLFPTKALARDQEASLAALLDGSASDAAGGVGATGVATGDTAARPPRPIVYDGDTPLDARRAARTGARVVLTNPDMLHSGILPHHDRWADFLGGLRLVVVDEAHVYRGVFGSHVGNVLRRLVRAAAFHGADPRFVLCSATVANPAEHAARLLGRPVAVVDRSGAPGVERRVVLYNPPLVDAARGLRRSYLKEARRLVGDLIAAGVRTLVFCSSRLHVELLLKYLREDQARAGRDADLVQGYRGGYLPTQRRRIERALREGRLLAVVATSALELGIDVGALDAVVVAGYPGSVAGTWQRFGRAGRRGGAALALLVASSDPLDQYLMRTPDALLGASPEHARIDPHNPVILSEHVLASAFELPYDDGERYADLGGAETGEVLAFLRAQRVLVHAGGRHHWAAEGFPADRISLRGAPGTNFVVIDEPSGAVLAEVDFDGAHTALHPGAIYNLDARQHQVQRLDYDNRKAYVRAVDAEYFTTAMTRVRVEVIETFEEGASAGHGAAGWRAARGEVKVQEAVAGYKKLRFGTHENVGYGEVSLPERTLHTAAVWIAPSDEIVARFPDGATGVRRALGAAGAAVERLAALVCMCDGHDLGRCVQDTPAPPPRPALYLYDRFPGGIGLSEHVFAQVGAVLARALALVEGCGCATGCPGCVGPAAAPGLRPRQEAAAILRALAVSDVAP